MLESRRNVAKKFVRGYRQGSADYVGMLQFGRAGMRVLTLSTREIATVTRATPIRQSRSAAAT